MEGLKEILKNYLELSEKDLKNDLASVYVHSKNLEAYLKINDGKINATKKILPGVINLAITLEKMKSDENSIVQSYGSAKEQIEGILRILTPKE